MKNKIIMILMSAMMLTSLSACDEKAGTFISGVNKESNTDEKKVEKEVENESQKETEKEVENQNQNENENNQDKDIKEDEKRKETVKVYFSDNQAMNLIEAEIDITLNKEESLEEKIIESLKSKPEDPEIFNAIDENIKINSVKVEDKLAKVDISSENLSGSSTQEVFLIDSIVASLTSLDTIDSVKFLVDEKEVDTLMGHMDVTSPFTKNDIANNIIKAEQ